jgi:putative transposase
MSLLFTLESMHKGHVNLNETDKDYLESILSKGALSAKVFKRATALLELSRGKTLQAVAETLSVNYNTVASWRDNYQANALACLTDKPRSGRPIEIDGNQRAKITALACSAAPAGHAKWSVRLLADRVVELGYVERVSHTQVANILKKTNSSRT